MFIVEQIQDFDRPELQPYRTMRRQMDHRRDGLFVAEGEKVVRRLLESRFEVVSVLMPEHWLHELKELLEARPERVQVYLAEKSLLETLTGFSMYQGLLAVGRIPRLWSLEQAVESSVSPRLFVAVDGLTSAENLGSLVRNAVAFGAQALIVGETSTSPYLRRAVRSSMGTIFKLPVVESESLQRALQTLAAVGFSCIGAHPHVDRRTLTSADFRRDACLVFGSEGSGISAAIRECCQDLVAIPMFAGVDSLNVGAAAAVFLYEANRQRGRMEKLYPNE
ncbi:23S rRNA (guanosine-2'-O-)-methyltransferase RlmB [bioreactor metagenome]|uniref:23S rRNA (Guanosine-2'-O-)-methyltransferase RlmB n=1 Tax=bioreactor metagenome TaxID=1076179 RepID=A0A645D5L8_9ZZZZ